MEALVVYPENKAQLAATKAVMKAMNVDFEKQKEVYPAHVINALNIAV